MKSIFLYFNEGSSDKVYNILLEASGTGYIVRVVYGRRGGGMTDHVKTDSPMSIEAATKVYDSIVKKQLGKGYRDVSDQGKLVQSYIDPTQTDIHCQLLTPIEEYEVERYLLDSDYIAMEKMDGERRLIKKLDGEAMVTINKQAKTSSFPGMLNDLELLDANFILDGELIGDKHFVFDILSINGHDLKDLCLTERMDTLKLSWKEVGGDFPFMNLVPFASTTDEKRMLLEGLKDRGAEGIVFKRKDSHYTAGRSVDQLKFKFYATASFVVTNVNSKRSVALGLYNELDGSLVAAGNVSIPVNHDVPAQGDIVEVKYLYAFRKSGIIFQPIYLGKRTDTYQRECVVSQLKYKVEEVSVF